MNKKGLLYLLLILLSLFLHTMCGFTEVRFRGRRLDLNGIRGKTHFKNLNVEKLKHPKIGRAMLMNPYAARTLDKDIFARSRAMTSVLCGDSCQSVPSEGTTSKNPRRPIVTAKVTYGEISESTTAGLASNNRKLAATPLKRKQLEDDEYYEYYDDGPYQYYEDTTSISPTTTASPKQKFNTSKDLSSRSSSKSTWYIPPFALSKSISGDIVVPAAKIGEKCNSSLYNVSIGSYLDKLHSKPGGGWTEDEEAKILQDFVNMLLDFSNTNDEVLTQICLNEYNSMSCHPVKQICGCASHGFLRLHQQPGTFTCTALLGSFCEEPFIYCTEDYDCVNSICVTHNYNTAFLPRVDKGTVFTTIAIIIMNLYNKIV